MAFQTSSVSEPSGTILTPLLSQDYYGPRMSEVYNPINEFIAKRDLRQEAAASVRDEIITQIEATGESINIYDARLMSQLFGPKSIDDVKDMF